LGTSLPAQLIAMSDPVDTPALLHKFVDRIPAPVRPAERQQRTLRLVDALVRVRQEKIEVVALGVGYRSTKNFYRAFRELTGLTPTGFRGLSAERAAVVLELAKLALMGRRRTGDRPVRRTRQA
jgi:methylphosphotriester-DNA--protein-cysteine methyltransferase